MCFALLRGGTWARLKIARAPSLRKKRVRDLGVLAEQVSNNKRSVTGEAVISRRCVADKYELFGRGLHKHFKMKSRLRDSKTERLGWGLIPDAGIY